MSQAQSGSAIESTMQETRVFPPPASAVSKAWINSRERYESMYRQSIDDPDTFWSGVASELHWFKRWDKVLDWNLPYAKWFVGGKTNMSYNCLEHQIALGRGGKTAILWEGEPCHMADNPVTSGGKVDHEIRRITYAELKDDVCRFANGLKSLGLKKGDRVTIYMPLVPEAAVAMLACTRLGLAHSVIFGGFSSQAIVDRVEDAESHVIITADGGYRRGSVVPLKKNVDEALTRTQLIKKVIVLKRTGQDVNWVQGRDVWWHDLIQGQSTDCPAEPMDAEDLLYILYTSGSTGKPKGIIHTTGGYMVGCYMTTKYVFDIHEEDVYWCTADVGWVTGHSYVVYGPLCNGATTVMYEGAPNFPDFGRFWDIIARHKVTIFYTAPTAIRAFMRAGREFPDRHNMESLRLLGSVGEPINPEAWMWYQQVIGHSRCPIVDTWWQTETGAIMITPLPGVTPTKPGSATLPFFGVDAAIVTQDGKECPPNTGGLLVIRKPWPSMLRGIFKDPDRYVRQYWSDVKGFYFTGDGARRDQDGYFWIMGRVDDVLNVSGHRLGTAEIESALVSHQSVAEAAVVGMPHELKGQGVAAFVTCKSGVKPTDSLKKELVDCVARAIGSIAKPDQIRFTDALPKTRSGKIMRRLLKEIASGGEVKGDTTTLEDFSVLAKLKEQDEA
jgi:acetyl-CoA synthetase